MLDLPRGKLDQQQLVVVCSTFSWVLGLPLGSGLVKGKGVFKLVFGCLTFCSVFDLLLGAGLADGVRIKNSLSLGGSLVVGRLTCRRVLDLSRRRIAQKQLVVGCLTCCQVFDLSFETWKRLVKQHTVCINTYDIVLCTDRLQ